MQYDTVSHVSGLVGRTELVLVIAVHHHQDSSRTGARPILVGAGTRRQHIYTISDTYICVIVLAARARAQHIVGACAPRTRMYVGAHAPYVGATRPCRRRRHAPNTYMCLVLCSGAIQYATSRSMALTDCGTGPVLCPAPALLLLL